MSSHGSTQFLYVLLVIIVFQLGLCVILLGEIAHGALEFRSTFVVVLQFVGGITVVGALAWLFETNPDSSEADD